MQISDDRIEEELRRVLRREQPSEGFAERVLARARAEETAPPRFWRSVAAFLHQPEFRVAIAAVVLLAVLAGTWQYRRYERERKASEAARQQLMLALRITGSKLQFAQAKIDEAGSRQIVFKTNSEDSQ